MGSDVKGLNACNAKRLQFAFGQGEKNANMMYHFKPGLIWMVLLISQRKNRTYLLVFIQTW